MMINSALNVTMQLSRGLVGQSRLALGNYALRQLFVSSKRDNLPYSPGWIFTNEDLGINDFIQERNRAKSYFGENKVKFYKQLKSHLEDDENVLLSDDLLNVINLSNGSSNDIALLQQAINKFQEQNESGQVSTHQFGPDVMKMAHHLNLPDLAMELNKKERIPFYSQLSSVKIALNLLFKNGRYEDVIKLFNFVINNYKFDDKYSADLSLICLAACYKLNTIEAFNQSYRLVRLQKDSLKRRSLGFFLALALKQNRPNIVLETFLDIKTANCLIRSIRLQALADIGRFLDICNILKHFLKTDRAQNTKKIVFQETLDEIAEKMKSDNKKDVLKEFEKVVKNLDESGLIEKEQTIDQNLMKPIGPSRRTTFIRGDKETATS